MVSELDLLNITPIYLLTFLFSNFILDPIDDNRFQKRMMKLTGVMEQCEQYKSLQPQFSLHINELIEWIREL